MSAPKNNAVAETVAAQKLSDSTIEKLALAGDVSCLNPTEKISYYKALCARVGVDPSTQPFKLLRLNGKEVFYADRSCVQQLSRLHKVSHEVKAREIISDCYVVTARAFTDSRTTESLGAVSVKGLYGDALCNAMMKAETKAKRRATLDLLGLGMLDESEIETIPEAMPLHHPRTPELPKDLRQALDDHSTSVTPMPEGAPLPKMKPTNDAPKGNKAEQKQSSVPHERHEALRPLADREMSADSDQEATMRKTLLQVLRKRMGGKQDIEEMALRYFKHVKAAKGKYKGFLLIAEHQTFEDCPLDSLESIVKGFETWLPLADKWNAENSVKTGDFNLIDFNLI